MTEKNICSNCMKEVKHRIKIETDETMIWDDKEWKCSIFWCIECLRAKLATYAK